MGNHPTLREQPRLYLENRANRLDRLCQLNAPTIILRGEVALILQALEEVIRQEEPMISDVIVTHVGALRAELTKDRETFLANDR